MGVSQALANRAFKAEVSDIQESEAKRTPKLRIEQTPTLMQDEVEAVFRKEADSEPYSYKSQDSTQAHRFSEDIRSERNQIAQNAFKQKISVKLN